MIISGFVGEDVILPCFFRPNEKLSHSSLNILWRLKSGNIRVHIFLNGIFEKQFQDKKFSERTKLFKEEFPKGNASLLLKDIQVSDAGIYECSVIITEYTLQNVELIVKEKTYGYTNESSIITISLPVVIFCILAGLCILLRGRKRSRGCADMLSTPSPESKKSK
ncbi:CD276 antigen homolog [Pyxicephalus adspersus]|uniref:CD276 antigen homolog n=1 Tax=Pyxicephalus adspersus TaxID=30357 RepID=UPI003B59507C